MGATLQSSAASPIPTAGSSDKSQPGPATRKPRTPLTKPLDTEGSQMSALRGVRARPGAGGSDLAVGRGDVFASPYALRRLLRIIDGCSATPPPT